MSAKVRFPKPPARVLSLRGFGWAPWFQSATRGVR